MNPISLSIAGTTQTIGKRGYDLQASIELMSQLSQEPAIDGFEFQNRAEWVAAGPPRAEADRRLAAWQASARYTMGQIATLLQESKVPILSVHANRDVGAFLCADSDQEIGIGKRLIHESLSLAKEVGAPVCVFHLWDTWKENFDPILLHNALREITPCYPRVKASVENVPTHLNGFTPFELVQEFEWITLDLQWAAMYDELDRFESVRTKIANVHLRGRLDGDRWALNDAPFGFYEAPNTIKNEWDYRGLLTVEPTGLRDGDLENLVRAMATLRTP